MLITAKEREAKLKYLHSIREYLNSPERIASAELFAAKDLNLAALVQLLDTPVY